MLGFLAFMPHQKTVYVVLPSCVYASTLQNSFRSHLEPLSGVLCHFIWDKDGYVSHIREKHGVS